MFSSRKQITRRLGGASGVQTVPGRLFGFEDT